MSYLRNQKVFKYHPISEKENISPQSLAQLVDEDMDGIMPRSIQFSTALLTHFLRPLSAPNALGGHR
jgi:hypothetical protein